MIDDIFTDDQQLLMTIKYGSLQNKLDHDIKEILDNMILPQNSNEFSTKLTEILLKHWDLLLLHHVSNTARNIITDEFVVSYKSDVSNQ